jgi:anti-anti-sigma factor
MPQDTPRRTRYRRTLDKVVVGFDTPYLQSEDDIAKAGAELAEIVEQTSKEGPIKMVLSFDGVRVVSSSMLAEVVRLHKKLTKEKSRLRVCGLSPSVRDVVRASQLDKLFEVFDNESAALAKY